MALVAICASGLLIVAGVAVLFSARQTWRLKKFIDNYAPSAMPEYWESTNRGIGVGLIAAGLLLIFVAGYL
ncbi:MAG: hypothetical protein ACOCZH_03335 [Phototrophicaceae bacterium]